MRRLSQIYEVPFSDNSGKALLASLAGAMIPASSGVGAASVLKSVPILGTIAASFVMPALSAGATYAIGKAFIQHFESGGTREGLARSALSPPTFIGLTAQQIDAGRQLRPER